MSSFTSPLVVEHLDGRYWRLAARFAFRVGARGNGGVMIMVPAEFITDFASVPRPFWPLLPPTGRWGKAAVLHDYLYRTGKASRVVADALFLEAMTALGMASWRRWAMYLAVRLFGARVYNLERGV